MKDFWQLQYLLLFIGLVFMIEINAQSYIKSLSSPTNNQSQKISNFKNGDILIGGSAFENEDQTDLAALTLTRMDACGNIVWSKAFSVTGMDLIFRDFLITESDQIFIVGITLVGLREAVFLMEVSSTGFEQRFNTFESPAAGTTTFSIDLQDDKILISGRILFINQATTGFLAVFDTQLNLLWAKRINPFTFEGASIFTQNGDLLIRSESLLFNFDAEGNLQWATRFNQALDPVPIAGPMEIQDGFLFQAAYKEETFFYKMNGLGELIWQSPLFNSTPFPAAVKEDANGQLMVHYGILETQGNSLGKLVLAANGELQEQQKLLPDNTFNVGTIFHSFGRDGLVNVVGNPDGLQSGPVDLNNFLVQYDSNTEDANCFDWVAFEETFSNDYVLSFSAVEADIDLLDWKKLSSGGIIEHTIDNPYQEVCGDGKTPMVIPMDTLLQNCKDNWVVQLPSEDFQWIDGFPESERVLETPGSYLATNKDCNDPIIYDFQLTKALCDCAIFIPNAFSPNGDGQNDVLEILTDCSVTNVETFVFDRWGNQLVNHVQSSAELWNGNTLSENAPTGIYLVLIKYQLLSNSGGMQEGTIAQDVFLIR